jgi:hypothetical protein
MSSKSRNLLTALCRYRHCWKWRLDPARHVNTCVTRDSNFQSPSLHHHGDQNLTSPPHKMARRGGGARPTHNSIPNGVALVTRDNLPPPSTIAAQIVHNRSHVARQEPENKALFGKLLQEYLKDPVVEEVNVETSAQLIGVVAEAGLDVLLKDDPFAPDTLLQQASDSLLVIQLTIRRTPGVLFVGSGSDSAEEQKPPLILWLLTKILSLLGRSHMDTIQDSLSTFLTDIVRVIRKGSQLWRASSIVLGMLRSIIEGMPLKTRAQRDSAEGKSQLSYPPLNSAHQILEMYPLHSMSIFHLQRAYTRSGQQHVLQWSCRSSIKLTYEMSHKHS